MTQTIDRHGNAAGPPDEPPADRDTPPIPHDTLGGLPLEPWYGPEDFGHRRRSRPRRARVLPVHPRRAPDHVPRQGLDDAPVRRLRRARGTPTSAIASCSARARRVCRSPSTCPRSWASTRTRRTRSVRSVAAVSPSNSVEDMLTLFSGIDVGSVTTSMTINSPAPILFAMYLAAADERGIPYTEARRDAPERHPQGVHRPEGVHLPDPAVDAPGHRRGRVLHAQRPELESDLDQRVPHPRGGEHRRAGACVHARRRLRVRGGGDRAGSRRRRVRAAGCRSSSTRTSTSSRRSPSTARRAASGRVTCATDTAPRTSVR